MHPYNICIIGSLVVEEKKKDSVRLMSVSADAQGCCIRIVLDMNKLYKTIHIIKYETGSFR